MRKVIKAICAGIYILIVFPISFYLQWKILHLVGATELMWFLFWFGMPFQIIACACLKLVEDKA